ncbi:MAG TPA: class I SAM-dependent methyltransferase, partial [Thermoleophilaceae bacterium]|nr:class I SAM-dependent methyltransferase [Thermoleophilaceae bacterium]
MALHGERGLLDGGREKAAAAGVAVDWVEGDAEAMPFEDGAFDSVVSTFGHMFAPRHQSAADEMARVRRKGGAIATCTWTPEGTVGELFRVSSSYMPAPPDFASPPILWGSEDHVRDMFGAAASDFEFERLSATIEAESTEAWADFFIQRFGPPVTARNMLGERFGSCGSGPSRFGRRLTRPTTAGCDFRRSTCCPRDCSLRRGTGVSAALLLLVRRDNDPGVVLLRDRFAPRVLHKVASTKALHAHGSGC